MKKAIQMWSFRDRVKDGESLLEALKIAAEIGYEGVEFAGTFGVTASEMKDVLAKLGLVSVSCHEDVNRIEKDIDEIIAYHHELGTPFIGCSYSPTETKEDLERLERVMKTAQEKAAPYGIKVVYHNHAHEFKPLEDVRPIDEIAKWCLLEPDTYWVFHAGDNPVNFSAGIAPCRPDSPEGRCGRKRDFHWRWCQRFEIYCGDRPGYRSGMGHCRNRKKPRMLSLSGMLKTALLIWFKN